MSGQTADEERILEALGWPCMPCTQVLRTVWAHAHDRHAIDRAAATGGYPNRQALSRCMQKHGFPAPRRLQDWIRGYKMVVSWENHGLCLQTQAYESGVEPTTLHRAIRRVTGQSWVVVREEEVVGWLARMAAAITITCDTRVRWGGRE